MTTPGTDWSQNGRGQRHPVSAWVYNATAPPTAVDVDIESGDIAAVTTAGELHLLNADGTCRRRHGIDAGGALDWADTSIGGVVQVGQKTAAWLDRQGDIQWTVECHNRILDVATSPFGNAVAISFADRHNVVLDAKSQPIGEFTSIRPLRFLQLTSSRPVVVGSAETGVVSSHTIGGNDRWHEQIWTNVGGLAVNGNGRTILLAAFNHGIQRFNNRGRPQGFYDIGGTAHLVSVSYIGTVIAAATMEDRFVLIDFDGSVLWQADLPEPLKALHCGAFGERIVCAFASGRIECLQWSPWARRRPSAD